MPFLKRGKFNRKHQRWRNLSARLACEHFLIGARHGRQSWKGKILTTFFPLSPYDVISFNSKFSHSSEGKRIEQENNKREENIFKVPPEKFL